MKNQQDAAILAIIANMMSSKRIYSSGFEPPVVVPTEGSPAQITSFSVVGLSALGATLTWTNPDGEASPGTLQFRLYVVSTSPGVLYELDQTLSNSPFLRPYTISGLTPGKDYRAFISAINADGQGPWSEALSFTTSASL